MDVDTDAIAAMAIAGGADPEAIRQVMATLSGQAGGVIDNNRFA
jgi:hypothetical protein